MNRATALYARVSTAHQEKQGTIGSQLAALAAYAARHELRIAPEHRYIDDGYSGARLDRPGLEQLRDAAWRGELDQVLILAPDRLARQYAYQYVVIEELERAGCAVRFVNGPGGQTPEERLVREVHGLFAEFERAALQERCRRGKLHAARAGRFLTGQAAYGYTYLHRDGSAGTCVVNDVEAAVVRQLFAWLIEDQLAVAAITRRLNGQGVPTRHGCATWAHSTVYRILTNRLYMGEHAYNKTESTPEEPGDRRHRPTKTPRRRLRPADEWIPIPWPALISPETFALAQRQLHLNGERSPRRMRSPYLLAGLLICGYCGRRLAGHAGRASRRYECTRRRSWAPRAPRCPLRSIHQADIEPVVWEQIRRLLSQPELILAHVRAQQAGEGPGLSDGQRELKRLEQQQAALARQEQRLLDAYQLGAVELEELKTRRQHLRATARQLEERAQLVRQQIAQLHQAEVLSDSVTTFCAHIQDQLVEPSFGTKQKLLRLVVERIVVTNDQLTIEHIIPSPDGRLHLRRDGTRGPRRSAPPPTTGRLNCERRDWGHDVGEPGGVLM